MSYLISERSTLTADASSTVDIGTPHIIPGVLYPAWSGLLTDNTAYTFTDSSPDALACTALGGISHSGVQKQIGSTSMRFDGVDDYITVIDNADWDWGTGNFTVEFWVHPITIGGSDVVVSSSHTGGTDSEFYCRFESGKINWVNPGDHVSSSTSDFAVNTWYHVAFVKSAHNSADCMKCYKNGTLLYSFNDSKTYAPTEGMIFGARKSGSITQFGDFYLDDVRITKGLAVYTGNFTVPSGPLTTTWSANPFGGSNTAANSTASNVGLLLHSEAGGHVGAWGTEQSDGKKYYYTDIKGSQPIEDPRIGTHYGSTRHRFSSLQPLPNETALNNEDVFSADGRKWIRFVKLPLGGRKGTKNTNGGLHIEWNTSVADNSYWFEVTGYFSQFNMNALVSDTNDTFNVTLNGVQNAAATAPSSATNSTSSPLWSRYVNGGSLFNVEFDTDPTLGINTVRIGNDSASYWQGFGCELIVQDTTSSTTRNQLQIQNQNVISYDKKFEIAAAAHHYNPFAYAADGTTAVAIGNTTSHGKVADGWYYDGTGTIANYYDSTLDLATCIGLTAWETGGDFYRPVNGGRVVKWVDSSGNIKTSVNMMPPAGQATAAATDSANSPTGHAWTTFYQPLFDNQTVDTTKQSEVARRFRIHEFGNGCANAGAGGTYSDFSFQDSSMRTKAWVHDDGLTSAWGVNIHNNGTGYIYTHSNSKVRMSFIGTGFGYAGEENAAPNANDMDLCVDMPYGTHIYEYSRADTSEKIDEVGINGDGGAPNAWGDFVVYQPKMPPIPKNAVVLADYMLMADHVVVPSVGNLRLSKGVRRVDCSREIRYDHNTAINAMQQWEGSCNGYRMSIGGSNAASKIELVAFCTNQVSYGYDVAGRYMTYAIDTGSGYVDQNGSGGTSTPGRTGNTEAAFYDNSANKHALGLVKHKVYGTAASSSAYCEAIDVVQPIHTSYHYQPWETPFTHELQPGDRTLEQNNLVVTPDGKTWDEFTRDTSYLGNVVLCFSGSADHSNSYGTTGLNLQRGYLAADQRCNAILKDNFCISFDRIYCLIEGQYQVELWMRTASADVANRFCVNTMSSSGTKQVYFNMTVNAETDTYEFPPLQLQRLDYIMFLREGGSIMGSAYESGPFLTIKQIN